LGSKKQERAPAAAKIQTFSGNYEAIRDTILGSLGCGRCKYNTITLHCNAIIDINEGFKLALY
jgi:hypothetical protein